jgi:hypothetical protein
VDRRLFQRQQKTGFLSESRALRKIANDGKMYVCDRGNDRIQVFDKNDATLGSRAAIQRARPAHAVSLPNNLSAITPTSLERQFP